MLGIHAQDTLIFIIHDEGILQGNIDVCDEFSKNEIDDKNWYGYYPWGGVSIDANTYTDPTMVNTSNGLLHLNVDTVNQWRAFPDWMVDQNKKDKMKEGKVYINRLTSAIWSKKQFRFGYFECRCLMPSGKGYWPAFWLYGGNPNEEIDFMEAKGERKRSYHVDVHCPNRCDRVKQFVVLDKPFGHWAKTADNLQNCWVSFSGLWTPQGVLFYFNDQLMAKHRAQFNTRMNLIANFSLAVDGGPFSPGPNTTTKFPASFKIDYIRAWNFESLNNYTGFNALKDASIIKVIPCGDNMVKFEFSSENLETHQVFIERESRRGDMEFEPYLELDLRAKEQFLDYTYWPKGNYYLRILNGTINQQVKFIERF